jgi:two-component system, response regulator PdtaR
VKILIVDDESLVRRSLHRVCVSRGHEVKEAVDGEQGLEIWESWFPDLVFLDVLMPKLNGPELLTNLKVPKTAKVVMMSAYTGNSNPHAGADLFLTKPFADIFTTVKTAEDLCHE